VFLLDNIYTPKGLHEYLTTQRADYVKLHFPTVNPTHWFKMAVCWPILSMSQHKRDKLINTINKHRVLRFVGGYPLPPDLNLKAASVRQAIAARGSNVVSLFVQSPLHHKARG
jgi:hypothetical protein